MWNRPVRSGAACAALAGIALLGQTALAGEADLEPRVEALEKRLEKLEKALESKDAEMARLKRRLRDLLEEFGEDEEDVTPEHRKRRPSDVLDRALKELRKRGFHWDFDWNRDRGLPGRRFNPFPQPRSIPLPGRSRAFLGVELEDNAGGGVAIARIVPDTPAEEAGLAEGDVIATVDGEAVSNSAEVVALVGAKEPGDEVSIAVLRDGEAIEIKATLGERPGPEWHVLPRGPSVPNWPGFGGRPRGEVEVRTRENTIEVEVDLPGGKAKVSFSAPGLFVTGELADELELDDDARGKVEEAFARARDDLGRAISELVRQGGGSVDAGRIAEKRLEAERAVREALEGVLTKEQLGKLGRKQAELASRSQVSISVTTGRTEGRTFRDEKPRRPAPHRKKPTDRGDGMEF